MNEEILEFETMDEVYEIMRKNLHDSHDELVKTLEKIDNEELPPLAILSELIKFSSLTYNTLDALLQIQLGIIKHQK